jgi:hypothetical protein
MSFVVGEHSEFVGKELECRGAGDQATVGVDLLVSAAGSRLACQGTTSSCREKRI